MSDPVFIGIDVASQTLEIARSDSQAVWTQANDVAGIELLLEQLKAIGPALVALEATGGYEFEVACALQAAGLAVAVVNPRSARDFARVMGALAKTDAIDARMLAGFARVLHGHPERDRFIKPLADAELRPLQALVLRRRQLVQMLTSERQRLRISHAAARPSLERHIELRRPNSPIATPRSPPTSSATTPSWPRRSAAYRGSARPASPSCWPSCPSLDGSIGVAWPRWWAWRPSTATPD